MSPRPLLPSLLLLLGLLRPGQAAPQSAPGPQPERWLLVVDVSGPMKNRATATREAVVGLLDSAMQGELQEGHDFGLWTFNDQLHTDLNVITWKATRTNQIRSRLAEHLAAQKYSRETRFGETLTNLHSVVRESRRLTVILFSDGDEVFQGTPFDDAIAGFFRENRAAAKAGKVPVITVLRGWHGRWIAREQFLAPWPVVFPPFPPEPEPKAAPAAAPGTNAGAGPVAGPNQAPVRQTRVIVAEPLIVRGPDPLSRELTQSGATNNPPAAAVTNTSLPELSQTAEVETNAATAGSVWNAGRAASGTEVEPRTTGQSSGPPVLVWVGAAIGLLVLGAGSALMLRRRAAGRSHVSVITRSMNGGADKREP